MSAISVSAVSDYIKKIIKEDFILKNLKVEGEVSNVSNSKSGHCYFTLKDEKASLKCVAWKYSEADTDLLEEGVVLQIQGSITTYPQTSSYQMVVSEIEKKDIGALFKALEALKAKLNKEGLFSEEHKKKMPEYPFLIGVVTSPHGAAIRDIIQGVRRRFPQADILLSPATVQGADAPEEIVQAIELLSPHRPDVIIVGRGGGSFEDLNAFNQEEVVRAVFACETPIVSAVGHEVDILLTDFAADLRAATPTAAAELVTKRQEDVLEILETARFNLEVFMENLFKAEQEQMRYFLEQLTFYSPITRLSKEQDALETLKERLLSGYTQCIEKSHETLETYRMKLELLSPQAVLAKGYSILFDEKNEVIRSAKAVKKDDKVKAQLVDGSLYLRMEKEGQEND